MVPVTFVTVKKQEPLAASVAPDRLTTPAPEVAVIVPLVDPGVQFPLKPLGVETTRPAGRVSVKATPVRATVEFGLVYVNVSVVPPLSGIDATPNAFATVGGEMVCAAKGNGASAAPRASTQGQHEAWRARDDGRTNARR